MWVMRGFEGLDCIDLDLIVFTSSVLFLSSYVNSYYLLFSPFMTSIEDDEFTVCQDSEQIVEFI